MSPVSTLSPDRSVQSYLVLSFFFFFLTPFSFLHGSKKQQDTNKKKMGIIHEAAQLYGLLFAYQAGEEAVFNWNVKNERRGEGCSMQLLVSNLHMHHEIFIYERLWQGLYRRDTYLRFALQLEKRAAVTIWYIATCWCLFSYVIPLHCYVDWKYSCIYTCVQFCFNASLTTSRCGLANRMTFRPQCVLGAYIPVLWFGRALFHCNPIIQNAF